MECPACGSTNVVSTTCSDQPLAKDIREGGVIGGALFNGLKKLTIGKTVPAYKCIDCGLTAPKTEWERPR